MRPLALALLLSCAPAYAEPKPAKPRKVERADAMEMRALEAEFAATRFHMQALERQLIEIQAKAKALRDRPKLAPDEVINVETGEVQKVRRQ